MHYARKIFFFLRVSPYLRPTRRVSGTSLATQSDQCINIVSPVSCLLSFSLTITLVTSSNITNNTMAIASKKIGDLPPSLKSQVEKIIQQNPSSESVFTSLIDHFQQQITQSTSTNNVKRKKANSNQPILPDSNMAINEPSIVTLEGTNIMLQLPDLSIQSPFRKKLNLVFGALKGEKKAYLALTKSLDSKPELLLKSLTPDNIKFAIILNVPEKKPLRYFLIDYITNDGHVYDNNPLLIQFNNDQLEEKFGSILSGKSFVQYLTSQLNLIDFRVLDGTTDNNEIFYVQAYKSTKDGYLYFLPNHVIFGFKKPIHIFNSTDIESITYTSITRLTFNLLINVRIHGVVEKFEFSMIDQKEFESIDKYIKTKDVRDNSMADEYKAQKQLKNNNETPGDLAEAAKLVPGGEQLLTSDATGHIKNGNNDDGDDDDEDDENYQIGDSDDDHDDNSGDEDNNIPIIDAANEVDDEDDEDEDDYQDDGDDGDEDDNDDDDDDNEDQNSTKGFTPGSFLNMDSYMAFDENLQDELQDLQKDLDIDIDELKKAGYIDM